MTHNVKHLPVLTPTGDLFQWTRNGIASGFQQTQLLDSWVNGLMLLTCLSEIGIDISSKKFFFKLQGDDSLCCFSKTFYDLYGRKILSMIARIATRRFNAKLSEEKSDITTTLNGAYVLGYYNEHGIARRTDLDLLSHLAFPEHPQDAAATMASSIGIAMAAQGCSHQVWKVCNDVYTYLKETVGLEPRWSMEDERKMTYLLGYEGELPTEFPSFLSTWMQNFTLETRDEGARQRTWPTDPERTGGFHFLLDL